MRAARILQRGFEGDLAAVHLARVRVFFAAVYSLLRSGRLSLTSLGRVIAERTAPKHGIKRVDRLLGNTRLHSERVEFYRAIARRLIRPGSRPVLMVDWTGVTGELWALVAAVSFEGRALIIYAETHGISHYLKPHVHAGFFERLRSVLPACTPIVLTDAGFRCPWMKHIEAHGWDFVGRIRGLALIRTDSGEAWSDIERLWRMTGAKPLDLGSFEIGRRTRYRARIVGVRKKRRYERRPSKRDHGTARQKRSAREPWILATSLKARPAQVVALYSRRMQIEETFRDTKSHRFGISLCHARTRSAARADILLLLATFAHVLYVLVGLVAESVHLQARYQANTTNTRRVLSLPMLGRLVFRDHARSILQPALSSPTWGSINAAIAAAWPP